MLTITVIPMMLFQLVYGSTECLVHPTDTVVVVGDKLSMQCNASGTRRFDQWTLGNEPGLTIYHPPVFNGDGTTDVPPKIAQGYFMELATRNRTILQSNSTKLNQSGTYHCLCKTGYNDVVTSSVNVAVAASHPDFEAAGDDLTCSITFNGSIDASFEFYIKDSNGTILSNQTNIPFRKGLNDYSVTHRVTYNSEDGYSIFTCEVKLVKNTTFEILYNASVNYRFRHANERQNQDTVTIAGAVIGAVITVVFLTLCASVIYRRRKRRATIAAMDKEKSGPQIPVALQQLAVPLSDGQPNVTGDRGLTRNGENSSSAKTCAHGNSELANGGIRRPPIDKNQIHVSTPVPNKEVHLEENDLYGSTQ